MNYHLNLEKKTTVQVQQRILSKGGTLEIRR